MLHQLGLELVEAEVEGAPGRARFRGRNEVGREGPGPLEGEGDVFCETGGECFVPTEGADISQADFRAGLVLRF